MKKSKNGKLNIGAVLDKSLDLDKIPVEYEYDLPDGTFEESAIKDDEIFYHVESDDNSISEKVESIDEMISHADAIEEFEYYSVEDIGNDSHEFDEISMSYDFDSIDPETSVIYEDGYSNKDATYADDLSEETAVKISRAINGEDFVKNFDLPENLLEEIKNDSNNTDVANDIDKLLGGGATDANVVKELPIFESAAEKILKQQHQNGLSKNNHLPFGMPDKSDSRWFSSDEELEQVKYGSILEDGLVQGDVNSQSAFEKGEQLDKTLEVGDGLLQDNMQASAVQEELIADKEVIPIDVNLPEFLKAYIDNDIEKEKNETEKQEEKPTIAGDKKMEENKIMDNGTKNDVSIEKVVEEVSVVSAKTNDSEGNVMETIDNSENMESTVDTENTIVIKGNKAETNSVVNSQVRKAVNDNVKSPSKNDVVRVCVDDGSVVCDVCGHLNKNATGVCEMCSNYLKVRR